MPYYKAGKSANGKTIIRKRLPGGGTKKVGESNNPDAYLRALRSHGGKR